MTKLDDLEFYVETITSVRESDDGYEINMGGVCFYSPGKTVVPKVGDKATFYGQKWGIIRGLDINGIEVFYRTPAEQKAKAEAEAAEREQQKKAEFEASKVLRDAEYDALPVEFRNRLDIFRSNKPDFRWDMEPYEMMVCREAVNLADKLKTPDAIKAYSDAPYEVQETLMLDQGHSGNSFGAAKRLAYLYLQQPELVEKEHGALCPLVGCKDYGCFAAFQGAIDSDLDR